jgi:hypothetical protein
MPIERVEVRVAYLDERHHGRSRTREESERLSGVLARAWWS